MDGTSRYYPDGILPQRYSHKKMCSEETILKRIGKIRYLSSTQVDLLVSTNGWQREEHIFCLKIPMEKEEFFSHMMRLSLTHWIDKIKVDIGVQLHLVDSKDGQTNITPDVIEAIYNGILLAEEQQDIRMRRSWIKSSFDGWVCGPKGY